MTIRTIQEYNHLPTGITRRDIHLFNHSGFSLLTGKVKGGESIKCSSQWKNMNERPSLEGFVSIKSVWFLKPI